MKDELYYKLLEEIQTRVLSTFSETYNSTDKKIIEEMEKAKDILVSSGHDLQDVNEFNSTINSAIANYFAGWGG
jgi:uncharacterized iron-regulated protein